MKVQQDSVEERDESPEPLYEEVGDFSLQVLKSLETSFRTSAHAETMEVPTRPISLGQRKTGSLDRMIGPNPVRSLGGEGLLNPGGSLDTLVQEESTIQGRSHSPSRELLLQELSAVFKKPQAEEQHSTESLN